LPEEPRSKPNPFLPFHSPNPPPDGNPPLDWNPPPGWNPPPDGNPPPGWNPPPFSQRPFFPPGNWNCAGASEQMSVAPVARAKIKNALIHRMATSPAETVWKGSPILDDNGPRVELSRPRCPSLIPFSELGADFVAICLQVILGPCGMRGEYRWDTARESPVAAPLGHCQGISRGCINGG
jgi:hypothetical protein